jgi:TetR/AcrR family transcriptional regulator
MNKTETLPKTATKISRREQVLTALATMLEESPGERITTAALAKTVGFSEAALYRHFPSKTKMFEGLIEFIEESIFSRITLILAEEKNTLNRCEQIVLLLLTFAERNPGLSRLLVGDALTGETERLRQRIAHFFDRVETQLKQVLREAELREGLQAAMADVATAHLLMAYVDGCISQFVRSEFQRLPTQHWLTQWQMLAPCLLR